MRSKGSPRDSHAPNAQRAGKAILAREVEAGRFVTCISPQGCSHFVQRVSEGGETCLGSYKRELRPCYPSSFPSTARPCGEFTTTSIFAANCKRD
jgi:hypothetical protein